jgi:PAS domain-containing protein
MEFVHTDDRPGWPRPAQLAHSGAARGYTEEFRVTQPPRPTDTVLQSRTAWLRESAFPVRGPGGELLRVTHIARDVTWQLDTTARLRAEISRRTDAERNLSDATTRLQALIATANDAVVTIDAQSLIIDWNNAAERMFGWTRLEAIGKTLTELIIPHAHRRHAQRRHRALPEGRHVRDVQPARGNHGAAPQRRGI